MGEKAHSLAKDLLEFAFICMLFVAAILVMIYLPAPQQPSVDEPLPNVAFDSLLAAFCQRQMGSEPTGIAYNPRSNISYVWCQVMNAEGWVKSDTFTREAFEFWLNQEQPVLETGALI